jgi:hypothetical protein
MQLDMPLIVVPRGRQKPNSESVLEAPDSPRDVVGRTSTNGQGTNVSRERDAHLRYIRQASKFLSDR